MKGGVQMNKKISIKMKASSVIAKLAEKIAYNDDSQLCLYYLYQPKKPDSLKKKKSIAVVSYDSVKKIR